MLAAMAAFESIGLFADAFEPLMSFAHGLTLCRDGDVVQWSFAGQSAIVAPRDGGVVGATFIGEPAHEVISGGLAAPAYCAKGSATYPLTRDGCTRMVADMVAFFGGTREPRFDFITTLPAA
jgi:hypothetical protein